MDVNNLTKMRVNLAAQVFSHSMATGSQTRVTTKELPGDALHTVMFVEKMDTLFDVLNSRKQLCDKPARCALTANSANFNSLMSLSCALQRASCQDERSAVTVRTNLSALQLLVFVCS